MAEPVVLATWSFGIIAVKAAIPVLQSGGQALDAVETGCRAVEADPSVNTVGVGGLPDAAGRVSLDASIMTAPDRCGGVTGIRRHRHPISIARAVMEKTPHVLLAGSDADDFADRMGFEPGSLDTPDSRRRWEKWRAEQARLPAGRSSDHLLPANYEEQTSRLSDEENHDTVGVLALDRDGRLAGACSTSGLPFKLPGRVGDSPIVGHGLYVHPAHGAAVATGTGELMMGVCAAFAAVEQMRNGASPARAAREVVERIAGTYSIDARHQVGLIVLAPTGAWSSASLRGGYVTICGKSANIASVAPAFVRF